MSMGIWPPISPQELKIKREEALAREIAWILDDTRAVMRKLKKGLDECYALLAPIDPGVTLAVSSHQDEKVKGVMTRLGTRVVKARIALQLRTLPSQILSMDPAHPIHVPALEAIQTHLNESIHLLSLSLDHPSASPHPVADHLRALSTSLASVSLLLGGPRDPAQLANSKTRPGIDSILSSSWQSDSCPPAHFNPPLPPSLSVHLTIDSGALILSLRSLTPADTPANTPANLGVKLGLALGVVRPPEHHDEMDSAYRFRYSSFTDGGGKHIHRPDAVIRRSTGQAATPPEAAAAVSAAAGAAASAHDHENDERVVYVKEKLTLRVEDASLHILGAKLTAVRRSLARARENLAAVMGEKLHSREAWGEM